MKTMVKFDRTLKLLNGHLPKRPVGRPRKTPPEAFSLINIGSERLRRAAKILREAGRLVRELERL
jgi:hypothetical protein